VSALLELEGVHAKVSGKPVLQGVDFAVNSGELVALCGPNGAGKSTAIRAGLGIVGLAQGRVSLGDVDVRQLSERQRGERAAYLPQERMISWNLPALEVVALGLPFLKAKEGMARALKVMAEVGVGHLAERGVAEMSGGERAKVLLARAMVGGAPLLLADEPVAGLDPDAQLLVLERLKARAIDGSGVLVSLHDLSLAAQFADRVLVLDQGRVVADGPPIMALSPDILGSVFQLDAVWIENENGPLLAARRRRQE
jgi:iron complex transport system ATP-binding protein